MRSKDRCIKLIDFRGCGNVNEKLQSSNPWQARSFTHYTAELDPAQVQIVDELGSQILRIDGESIWLNSNTGFAQTTVAPAEIGATAEGKVVEGKKDRLT